MSQSPQRSRRRGPTRLPNSVPCTLRPRADTIDLAAAYLSPWQGIGSPSSSSASEFESVHNSGAAGHPSDSDIEIVLDPAPQPPRVSSLSPEYARSISRRGRDRSLSVEEEQDLGRGVEGDDEDSSAFEDAGDDARGRGRTRERRRDPELKRSMLEDALRSSLSTILSLAPAHAGMSQTPQMSQVSLANLLSAPRAPFVSSSSPASSRPSFPPLHRPSAFASSLAARFEEEEDEDDEDDYLASSQRTPQDDVLTTSSEDEEDDDDNQTELSPYTASGATASRAIPIPSRRQAATSRDDAFFSPLQPSRPLGAASSALYPSSDSPPVYSRRRGARRGRGTTRGRGHGASGFGGESSLSPGPGPASLEERRRAKMLAAQQHGASQGKGERGGTQTDIEDETVQPDEAFAELLSAARFFSDLSPRASHTRSLPNSFDSSRTTRATARPPQLAYGPTSTPLPYRDGDEGEEEEDPALASESVPTLGGLSSGAEGSRSPASQDASPLEQPVRKGKNPGPLPRGEEGKGLGDGRKEKRRGWFEWLGIGKTVELKVWHLVGLCGVLVGVGWGASTLIRAYVLSHASSIATNSSLCSRSIDFASLPASPLERPSNTMSSLFL
ncbi:hypothetical protein JCM11491_002295 [Sporobolomyces phaffii]